MTPAYDRELIASMLTHAARQGSTPYSTVAIKEQIRLLEEADNAEAARIGTVDRSPSVSGDAGELPDRWVTQTKFYDPALPENIASGNCTQAAIASILGLPLSEVPDWAGLGGADFWEAVESFVGGLGYEWHRHNGNYVHDGLYLASGQSARGCSHMVVMEAGKLRHDPHPSRAGIQSVDHVYLLVPKDPAIRRLATPKQPDRVSSQHIGNLMEFASNAPRAYRDAPEPPDAFTRDEQPGSAGEGDVEYEFEVWQDDSMQAGGSTTDYSTAKGEADHCALMYGQDGPVEVRMYEKRRITTPPPAPAQPAEKVRIPEDVPTRWCADTPYTIMPAPAADPFVDGNGVIRSGILPDAPAAEQGEPLLPVEIHGQHYMVPIPVQLRLVSMTDRLACSVIGQPFIRDLLGFTEHCLSAADEGEDYAVSREWLDAMTTLGLLEKTGRGKWAPTKAAEQFVFAGQNTQPEARGVEGMVLAEVERATAKFPTWPTDPLHAVAVLGEEFGELTKAVLQSVYEPHKNPPGAVRTEALQTAAMALRFLASVDRYEAARCPQHKQGEQ